MRSIDESRGAVALDRVAQGRGERVDRAAFDSLGVDHRFAAHRPTRVRQGDRLQRLAGEARAEAGRPVGPEAAIGGLERRDLDPGVAKPGDPGAVAAEPQPGSAPERQHDRCRARLLLALRRAKAQNPPAVGKADQPTANLQCDAEPAEAAEPGLSSGVDLKLLGKTRPEEPTNVSSPSSAAQARSAAGGKRSIAAASRSAAAP